jgi:hypothetical protein
MAYSIPVALLLFVLIIWSHLSMTGGSISAKRFLRSAVDEFKRSINGNVIDLLVISHLDEDHANRLEFLLSDPTKVKVKFAILPYLSNLERLYIIASTKSQNQGYIGFLVDPLEYLLGKCIEKVYLIRGGKRRGVNSPIDAHQLVKSAGSVWTKE